MQEQCIDHFWRIGHFEHECKLGFLQLSYRERSTLHIFLVFVSSSNTNHDNVCQLRKTYQRKICKHILNCNIMFYAYANLPLYVRNNIKIYFTQLVAIYNIVIERISYKCIFTLRYDM